MDGWIVPVASALVAFAGSYVGVRITVARIESRLNYLENEVGRDSRSGLRGRVHKRKGQIGTLAAQIDELRERAELRPLDLQEAFRKDDD